MDSKTTAAAAAPATRELQVELAERVVSGVRWYQAIARTVTGHAVYVSIPTDQRNALRLVRAWLRRAGGRYTLAAA